MRILLSALLCFCFVACSSTKNLRPQAITSVEIVEIKPRYIDTESFVRISEYLTGVEKVGGRVIIRSQPEERDGYYFTLLLDTNVRELSAGTVFTGEFYTPFSKTAQTFEFTLPSKRAKTKEVFIGLTGTDWPDPSAVPSAWRITVTNANGMQLAQKQSFLWE
jgi:hypothetical protein